MWADFRTVSNTRPLSVLYSKIKFNGENSQCLSLLIVSSNATVTLKLFFVSTAKHSGT